MTDMVLQKNIGAYVLVRNGSTSTSATAAGSGDATTKTGVSYDRFNLTGNPGSMPMSAVAAVLCDATLQSGATLKVAVTVSHSADNSTFADYATTASTTVLTGPGGGGARSGQIELDVDLSSANRYVRLDHIPDLSSAGTDTSLTRAAWTFAGQDRLPA